MCRPYWLHGDRGNRPDPLRCNGSGRFVSLIHPSRIPTVTISVFVVMYYFHPFRLAKSSIAKQNLSHRVNAVCNGSPSRMRMVRRISLGMTTRPRSSILRTIPVAFIIYISPLAQITFLLSAKEVKIMWRDGNQHRGCWRERGALSVHLTGQEIVCSPSFDFGYKKSTSAEMLSYTVEIV